jgi:hypothetical protein
VRRAPNRTQLHEVRTAHEHESSVAVAHHRPSGGSTFLPKAETSRNLLFWHKNERGVRGQWGGISEYIQCEVRNWKKDMWLDHNRVRRAP